MWYFAVKISIPNCECHCNALKKYDFMGPWKRGGKATTMNSSNTLYVIILKCSKIQTNAKAYYEELIIINLNYPVI